VTAPVEGERRPLELAFRHATPEDLPVCASIWRSALNAYIVRLGQPEVPDELGPITRLYGHLHATDPGRFVVATTPDPGKGPDGERVVGFTSAVVRDDVWFLSMLFVLPKAQGSGVGRALLERVLPDDPALRRAIGTDSAQPISNALYASYGLVPRMPLLNLVGLPDRPDAFGELPSGVTATAFDDIAAGRDGHRALVELVDGLDRRIATFTHPADHRYLRAEGRRGWLYRGPDGTPAGYGYASEAGRAGPIAVDDPTLVAPVIGHLLRSVTPRGAFSIWLPGHADRAVVAVLRAGFRLEPFPVLLCWDRPPADFERYLPISPGLL
jgi:GNAT superfamily N-acetyltransferase